MKNSTVAKLFALAAGRCSICRINAWQEGVKISDMAHIIAQSDDGPRGDEEYDGDIDGYNNLILLCAIHHRIVDGNQEEYPTQRLLDIKADHEQWVETLLADHSKRHVDIDALNALMRYLPFIQLRSAVEFLPGRLNWPIWTAVETLNSFPIDKPHCEEFHDSSLNEHYKNFCNALMEIDRATSEHIDDHEPYFFPDGEGKYMLRSRNLLYKERILLEDRVNRATEVFLPVYKRFLDFLKSNYPEVDITSFRWNS
ncbi:HNH endonuclease [Burkholderia sp. SRS-25]|uniref:HNH endonuclease n=1 Tax=Burkholderia sp. SRS-25 TaxID=2094190 RepID=UPI00104BABAC|nr:HNH endonuclease [Burkholderia sp. SRS-25]